MRKGLITKSRLVTDGGFRADGTFMRLLVPSPEVLTEAFQRGVLKLFVEREVFEPEVADGMLDWLHSGFSVHDNVRLYEDDAAAHERLARHCARCPVLLDQRPSPLASRAPLTHTRRP